MDKYEFNIKTEQIKKLIRKKDYAQAAKIADSIDFSKVKNNALLITVADVYEVIGEYDSARDILEIAYERSQLGRQIAFRLTRISVKRKDLESALEYYEDFKAVAPKDASCYILQYEISKLKNDPIENQIAILGKYVEDDMDDKWTYELAKLHHKAGNIDKCIELCDTIILWFSEGKYVDKAMELKMLYAPLTKSQQEKYDKRWEDKEPEINVDDIKLKEVSVDNKYDTYNIQAEIAKSMVELFGEEVPENDEDGSGYGINGIDTDNNDDIFKPDTDNSKVNDEDKAQEDFEKTKVIPNKQVIKEIAGLAGGVAEEIASAGVSHANAEDNTEDEQIEGQITLDELLNGMYKPQEDNSTVENTEKLDNETEAINDEIEKETDEAEDIGEVEELKEVDEEEILENTDILYELDTADDLQDIEISEEDNDLISEENDMGINSEEDKFNTSKLALDAIEELLSETAEATEEETADSDMAEKNEEAVEAEANEESEQTEANDESAPQEAESTATSEESTSAPEESAAKSEEGTQKLDVKKLIKEFVEKYSGVDGLDKQVIKVLQNLLRNSEEKNDYLYVMGDVKSGKTTLAMEIIKLMGKVRVKDTKKIAKVNGTSFTKKNLSTFVGKLGECDVVIEKATSIEPELFIELLEILDNDSVKRIVVFEDERTMSEKYMVENKEIAEHFENIIKLKHNEIKDWAKIAMDYASEKGYSIDEMGILALHAKIDQLYTVTLVIHKNHVEQLIDIAIDRAEKKSIGKFIKGLFGNKDKEKVLTESDFLSD